MRCPVRTMADLRAQVARFSVDVRDVRISVRSVLSGAVWSVLIVSALWSIAAIFGLVTFGHLVFALAAAGVVCIVCWISAVYQLEYAQQFYKRASKSDRAREI